MKPDQRIIILGVPMGVDLWNNSEPMYFSFGCLAQGVRGLALSYVEWRGVGVFWMSYMH